MPKRPTLPGDEIVDMPQFPGQGWISAALPPDLSSSSVNVYASHWRSYLVFLHRRGRNAQSATTGDANEFLAQYAPAAAIRRARLFSAVYDAAISDHRTAGNPFRGSSLLKKPEPQLRTAAIALKSISELIGALSRPRDWKQHRDQAVVVMGVDAGLRLQELVDLELVQVHERARGLEVAVLGHGAHSRDLVLSPDAARFVRDWIARRRGLEMPGPFVFPDAKGRQLRAGTLYRRVRQLLEEVYGVDELPHYGAGVLRTTFAYVYSQINTIPQTQYALGHLRIVSTVSLVGRVQPVNPHTTLTSSENKNP